ncbi:prohibitin family protein [Chromobacterium sp. ATCC 53434]|uniref:prohibitin family protein n=1 Tax=Chromobacterium sp. (strain ATCC 53434 / SC 14030) TaxID=2059672 RepID=UPI0013053065|nr:prohibitin family protein [Chromobacterium sp. ATCC 53434]
MPDAAVSAAAPRRPLRRFEAWLRELTIPFTVAFAIFVFLLPLMIYTIRPGQLGVQWKRFQGGTQLDHIYGEGTHIILPWDHIYIYDSRLQRVERDFDVLSSDGLTMKVSMAWRFRINPSNLPYLHRYAGENYAETLVAPSVGARTRDVIAYYRPEQVYTQSRLTIQQQILSSVRYDLVNNFNPDGRKGLKWVEIEDILIKAVTLPPGVQEAIIKKNTAYQEMQTYNFLLSKEEKEAERKRIEATGIRHFQEIVSNGMSDSYLRWRGIEATIQLAKSDNAKVVVIGAGSNGLPLIMNMDDKKAEASKPKAPSRKP